MIAKKTTLTTILLLLMCMFGYSASNLSPEEKALIDSKIKAFTYLGTDATVIAEVKAYNANPNKTMTQDAWAKLTVLDEQVKAFTKNKLATYLKTKKDATVTELFVSGSDGTKVAFFGKTSSWSHKGKAKHDVPMTGKVWIGDSEVDQSTGKKQVQVGFPVLVAGKAIGSIVIGFDFSKH